MKPKRTKKQRIIVGIVLRKAGEGTFMTMKDLHAALPYSCAYGSFRRSIEFLEHHRIIYKERAGRFFLIKPTTLAYAWFSPEM